MFSLVLVWALVGQIEPAPPVDYRFSAMEKEIAELKARLLVLELAAETKPMSSKSDTVQANCADGSCAVSTTTMRSEPAALYEVRSSNVMVAKQRRGPFGWFKRRSAGSCANGSCQ